MPHPPFLSMILRGLAVSLVLAASAAASPRAGMQIVWAQVVVVPPGSSGITQTEVTTPPTDPPPQPPQTQPPPTPGTENPGGQPVVLVPGVAIPAGTLPSTTGTSAAPGQQTGASPGAAGSNPAPPGSAGTAPRGPVDGAASGPANSPSSRDSSISIGGAARSPAAAGATSGSNCTAVAEQREILVPASGGSVSLTPKFSPASCRIAPTIGAPWIAAEGLGADNTNYLVAPNLSRAPRQASIAVGNAMLTVRQEAGKLLTFSAAPGRVDVETKQSKSPKAKKITVWSQDTSATFAVAPAGAPWLRVEPDGKPKNGRSKFRLVFTASALPPGTHKGAVEVHSPGALASKLRIPVWLTVTPKNN